MKISVTIQAISYDYSYMKMNTVSKFWTWGSKYEIFFYYVRVAEMMINNLYVLIDYFIVNDEVDCSFASRRSGSGL